MDSPILKQNQSSPFYGATGQILPCTRNSKIYEEKRNSTQNVSKINLVHHHPVIQSTNKFNSTPSSTLLSSPIAGAGLVVVEGSLDKQEAQQDRISFESRINSKRPSALHLFLSNMSKKNETTQQPQIYSNPLEISSVPRKTMLFQLQQMINEDKAVIDRRSFNKSADISAHSLLISQNALVLPKNTSIFSPTLKQHQRNSFSINGNCNTSNLLFKPNKNSLPYFSQSRKDSLVSDSRNSFYQTPSNRLKMDCQKTKQQSISLSPSSISTTKTTMPGYEKIKQQRKINERRILSQIEHRVKTFSRFGFKMIEKEDQTHSVGPFIQASSPHDPKGTMFVSDLWTDATILKFLGNCNMIRDKLTLNKLCKKKQNIPQNAFANNDATAPGSSNSTRVRNNSQDQSQYNQSPQQDSTQNDPKGQMESIIQDEENQQDQKIEANIIKEFYWRIAKKQQETEESKRECRDLDNSIQKVTPASQGLCSTRSTPLSNLGTAHSKNNQMIRSFKIKGQSTELRKESPKLQDITLSNKSGNPFLDNIAKPKKINSQNNKEKNVLKVQNWIKQLDSVTKDNDKTYDVLNKRIDELQDAILKSNEFNKFVNE